MNSALRKRHRFIWLAIGAVIPVLVILSIIYKPHYSRNTKILEQPEALDYVASTFENQHLLVNIRTDNSSLQLELEIKKPFKAASASLHIFYNPDEKVNIGRLGGQGIYRFEIKEVPLRIEVFDFIKEEIVTELVF